MAEPKTTTSTEATDAETEQPVPAEWKDDQGWQDASADDGYQVDLTKPFEGVFLRARQVTNKSTGEILTRFVFEDLAGERCSFWPGYFLRQSFEQIEPGELVRIAPAGTKKTGAPSPMKTYHVLHRPLTTPTQAGTL